MQLAALRPLIERLNVCQAMVEPITPQIDLILRHRIEHERVIGIGGNLPRAKTLVRCLVLLCMKVFAECTNFMLGRELVESKSVRAPRSADFSATGRNSKSTSLWHSHARLPPARETRGRVVLRDVSPGRFVAQGSVELRTGEGRTTSSATAF